VGATARRAQTDLDGRPEPRTPGIALHVESIRRETHPESGAVVTQLTSAAYIHSHIYPEAPVFTPDSRRFVYARFRSLDRPREYWICDLGAPGRGEHGLRRLTSPDDEPSVHGPVVTPDGRWFVYVAVPAPARPDAPPSLEVRRRPLDDPGTPSEVVCTVAGFRRPYTLGTISPNGRYYATAALRQGQPEGKGGEGRGVAPASRTGEPPVTGILVADLHERRTTCVHEGPDIFNAHPQIDPGAGHDLLIQHNRGGVLCHSGTSLGRPQYTHGHPFFSPDARHAFFNSDRTGLGQIYTATIPEGFLASLDER
jgi:Tol biopolymer transport system component